jgi:hypothetical protein
VVQEEQVGLAMEDLADAPVVTAQRFSARDSGVRFRPGLTLGGLNRPRRCGAKASAMRQYFLKPGTWSTRPQLARRVGRLLDHLVAARENQAHLGRPPGDRRVEGRPCFASIGPIAPGDQSDAHN